MKTYSQSQDTPSSTWYVKGLAEAWGPRKYWICPRTIWRERPNPGSQYCCSWTADISLCDAFDSVEDPKLYEVLEATIESKYLEAMDEDPR